MTSEELARQIRVFANAKRRELREREDQALRFAPAELRADVIRLRREAEALTISADVLAGVPIVVDPVASSRSIAHSIIEPKPADPVDLDVKASNRVTIRRQLYASPDPLLPCVACGSLEDWHHGERRPPRYDGQPWGVQGLICRRCWRARRRPEHGTAIPVGAVARVNGRAATVAG